MSAPETTAVVKFPLSDENGQKILAVQAAVPVPRETADGLMLEAEWEAWRAAEVAECATVGLDWHILAAAYAWKAFCERHGLDGDNPIEVRVEENWDTRIETDDRDLLGEDAARADQAAAVLAHYPGGTVDFLTDLLHLFAREGESFGKVLKDARMHFVAEHTGVER